MPEDKNRWVPPYIAFATLTSLIDRMHDEDGAPPQIDRSYLRSFSGGYQAQVLAALKSLGLIEDDGIVTDTLTRLVEASERSEREPIIADILHRHYPEPVRLGAVKATQGQLETAFREYGLTGDTLRKAIAFYLAAAKYSNIPVSVNFRVPSVAPSTGTRRRRKAPPPPSKVDEVPEGTAVSRLGTDWEDRIDPAVLAWLQRIPSGADSWPKADRDRWNSVLLALFGGVWGEE
jgi:hypothetical protein